MLKGHGLCVRLGDGRTKKLKDRAKKCHNGYLKSLLKEDATPVLLLLILHLG